MAKKKVTYRDLMEHLEEIISELEKGEISIEDSMTKYEEGVKITKELLEILNKAEEKVKIMNGSEEVEF
jgi:exodeoxyribonuclease VII small subunit